MPDKKNRSGPEVLDTWVTSQRAVNAFREFSLSQKWVFTETPQQNDFGKDGYLDISENGQLTGQCIAVQIKGGVSFRRNNGYSIPADKKHRRRWRDSSVPVFGIVWDPDDESLYWIAISRILEQRGEDSPLVIPEAQKLDPSNLDRFLEEVRNSTISSSIVSAVGSDDPELQLNAVSDCYGLGRTHPEYLIFLRRIMFSLQMKPFDLSIYILNQCTLNGDLFLDSNWMHEDVRATVRRHFIWTIDEAVALLDRVPQEDGIDRGTFGSCIYWLLVGTDDERDVYACLVRNAFASAADSGMNNAAIWALVLAVYWAGEDGSEVYDELLHKSPRYKEDEMIKQIGGLLDQYGYISL